TIDRTGIVGLTGNLADGTTAAQGQTSGTLVSRDGLWPMYLPLYAGGGSLLGWVSFTNSATGTNAGGAAVWVKLANPTNTYNSAAFPSVLNSTASASVMPPGSMFKPASPLTLTLDGADLSAPVSVTGLSLSAGNVFSGIKPPLLKLTVTPTYG